MPTSALKAQGCQLKIGNGASPEVFTAIAEILDLNGPNRSVTMIDATTCDSTDEEFIAGVLKGGTVTFSCHLIPGSTGQDAVVTAFAAKTLKNFQVILSDSGTETFAFAAYISALGGPQYAADGKVTRSITLQVSGAVTES